MAMIRNLLASMFERLAGACASAAAVFRTGGAGEEGGGGV